MGQWVGCYVEQNTGDFYTICVWGINQSPVQLSYGSDLITLGTDSYIFSFCTTSIFSATTCDCVLWVNPFAVPLDVPGEGIFGLDYIIGSLYDSDEACNSCVLDSITYDSYTLTSYDCSNRLPLSHSCPTFSSDVGCISSEIPTPTNPTFANPTDSPINAPNPTRFPINAPNPTRFPIKTPVLSPTRFPINPPSPTDSPTRPPTVNPTDSPTKQTTLNPTKSPTSSPTLDPTDSPTQSPTPDPTRAPVQPPTVTTTAGLANELPSTKGALSSAAAAFSRVAVVGIFLVTVVMAPAILL
jgi:hypothetical protein